jgi:hypothetical protein
VRLPELPKVAIAGPPIGVNGRACTHACTHRKVPLVNPGRFTPPVGLEWGSRVPSVCHPCAIRVPKRAQNNPPGGGGRDLWSAWRRILGLVADRGIRRAYGAQQLINPLGTKPRVMPQFAAARPALSGGPVEFAHNLGLEEGKQPYRIVAASRVRCRKGYGLHCPASPLVRKFKTLDRWSGLNQSRLCWTIPHPSLRYRSRRWPSSPPALLPGRNSLGRAAVLFLLAAVFGVGLWLSLTHDLTVRLVQRPGSSPGSGSAESTSGPARPGSRTRFPGPRSGSGSGIGTRSSLPHCVWRV